MKKKKKKKKKTNSYGYTIHNIFFASYLGLTLLVLFSLFWLPMHITCSSLPILTRSYLPIPTLSWLHLTCSSLPVLVSTYLFFPACWLHLTSSSLSVFTSFYLVFSACLGLT